jgi:hypothetical protein
MRKLLIVPAILAMTCGSAFAQRIVTTVPVTGNVGNGSASVNTLSPVAGANGAVNTQVSTLNILGSGNQSNTSQQSTAGAVGINGGITSVQSR